MHVSKVRELLNNVLNGAGVLVTRPEHQAGHLSWLIEQVGGKAIRFPTLAIAGVDDVDEIKKKPFRAWIVINALFLLASTR